MRKLLVVALVLFMAGSAFAWEINTEEEKGEAGGAAPYLKTGVGSRALAMGSAFTAVANDATATYWNPAGITQLEKMQVALVYSKMSLDRSYNFVSFVMPKQLFLIDALGASVILSGVKDIPGYDVNNYPTEEFNETNLAILVSLAKKIDEEISAGLNLKVLRNSLKDSSAFGLGFDIGALAKASEKLNIGIMLQDVYTGLRWESEHTETVPLVIKAGAAYHLLKNNRLKLCADIEKFATRKRPKLNFGAELILPYNIAIRPGLSDNFLTAGFGCKVSMFSLDYCYRADKLKSGDTHQITVMISF